MFGNFKLRNWPFEEAKALNPKEASSHETKNCVDALHHKTNLIATKLTLLRLRFKLSRTPTSVTRSAYLLCCITNGQLLKTSVWDNPASADTSLQSASLLIMQWAPFTGLSLLPATQLGVSLIGRLQWSTANACLQSVSTEPFTQPAGVQIDPIREEGRDRTIYRNRRRLVTWRWKSTGLVTRVGTP